MNIDRAFKVTDCQRCEKAPSRYVVADLRAQRPFWELLCYRCIIDIPSGQREIALVAESSPDHTLDGLAWALSRRCIGPGDLPTLFVRAASRSPGRSCCHDPLSPGTCLPDRYRTL